MEALFSTELASYEAWIMLLCILVFIGIYLFDGITFIQRVIDAFTPKPPILPAVAESSDAVVEVISPMLEEITPEEIQAHEEEKEIQTLEEEGQTNKLEEEEVKMIEEAETKNIDEVQTIEETPIIEEVVPELEEASPEPEAISEETIIQEETKNIDEYETTETV